MVGMSRSQATASRSSEQDRIPSKLFQKIQKWEYVSTSELLPDNLDLVRWAAEAQRGSACSSKSPKKRDVTEDWKGLVAWSISFNAFVAIVTRRHPLKFQELLAYHATILMEALRKGWLSYDKISRIHREGAHVELVLTPPNVL